MAPSIELIARPSSFNVGSTLGQRFWNANLAPAQWAEKCPEYLLGLGSKDTGILLSKQEGFHIATWEEAKGFVESNRIDRFQRSPLELRRYLQYMYHLKKRFGSVLSFVQTERLRWKSISPSGDAPFENDHDIKILYNDWPYAIDPDITHLVVWVKFELEDDANTGFLTPEHYGLIDEFVQETFCGQDGLPRDEVIWFKNWTSLKSIHALEHFHVMLYQAPTAFLERIARNDRPMCEVVGEQ